MWKYLALGLAALGLSAASLAQEGPLASQLNAYVLEPDADGEMVRRSAEDVEPGDKVEYELVYENLGDSELSGLVVSAPIPSSMVFVAGSNATGIAAPFQVSADDGASWSKPPILVATEEGEVEVPVSEYDVVRWSPDSAIAPGETWTFSYSAIVE